MKRLALAAIGCVMLAGCQTPEPVLSLAEKTSSNVGLVSSEIQRLAVTEDEIANLRAESLANYAVRINESQAALALDVATTQKVDPAAISLKNELETWIQTAQTAGKPVGGNREQIVEQILATQKKLSPASDQLLVVAKTLAKLAKEQTVPERAAFLLGYAKEVRRLIQANQESAKSALSEAKTNKENIEKAAETLPPPSNENEGPN